MNKAQADDLRRNHKVDCLACENLIHFWEEDSDKWKSLAGELADAVKATDIYFKALCEQWAANDGRVVSESGTVIAASKDVERLCEIAASKVGLAEIKAREAGL